MVLLVLVVAVALAFDFTNGFHDTANYIATWVGTRALSPRPAVLISAGGSGRGGIKSGSSTAHRHGRVTWPN